MEAKISKPLEEISDAELEGIIDYYTRIQDELARLETSKEIARDTIIRWFAKTGNRKFTTSSGATATTFTQVRESISVKEAKALLSEDLLNKLLKVSEPKVILAVRRGKTE